MCIFQLCSFSGLFCLSWILSIPIWILGSSCESLQKSRPRAVSLLNCTKHLRKKLYQLSTMSFRKKKKRKHFPTYFMRSILWPWYHNQMNTKRKTTDHCSFLYRLKSSQENTRKPNPENILTGLYTVTKSDLSQECKFGATFANLCNILY